MIAFRFQAVPGCHWVCFSIRTRLSVFIVLPTRNQTTNTALSRPPVFGVAAQQHTSHSHCRSCFALPRAVWRMGRPAVAPSSRCRRRPVCDCRGVVNTFTGNGSGDQSGRYEIGHAATNGPRRDEEKGTACVNRGAYWCEDAGCARHTPTSTTIQRNSAMQIPITQTRR